jgi:hypothetical protein
MTKNLSIKLGCDPELFMMDRGGIVRSAIGRIGGSKYAPMPLVALGDGFAVQEDNVAMEFNIPPAANAKEFVDYIGKTIEHLTEGIKKQYDFDICPLSAARFGDEELDNPAAKVFGCDPDFNAWTGRRNPRPRAADKNLRSCGGHIHVGYLDDPQFKDEKWHHPEVDRAMARAMDLFLGVPSVMMDNGDLRKQLYGKAGAYRQKSYGVEYRTLSNFWVLKPRLIQWAWENTERAVKAVVEQFPVEEDKDLILEAINANEKDIAQHLCNKYKLDVIHV